MIYPVYAQTSKLMRQSYLIHEARHSDCSGGVSEADLSLARRAQSMDDYLNQTTSPKCGYFHSLCKGGYLKGIRACDEMPWGSYGVQAVYIEALLEDQSLPSMDTALLQSALITLKQHIQLGESHSFETMKAGDLGGPDLSSQGVR